MLAVDRPALRLLRKLPKFGDALEATYREYGLKRILEDLNQASVGAFSAPEMKKLEEISSFRFLASSTYCPAKTALSIGSSLSRTAGCDARVDSAQRGKSAA